MKYLADSNFYLYGPEYFLACDNLASLLKDEPKQALKLYREALNIRLMIHQKGIWTRRKTTPAYPLPVLPPLKQAFKNLAVALLESDDIVEALHCLEDFEKHYS